jgi:hypothetical protein
MCVIAVSLKGNKFLVDDLKKMWDANSHGAGDAWCDGSVVRVREGFMKFEKFIEFYEEEVPRGVMHAIHFRLRSAGELVPQLTHPFRVDVVDVQELEYVADRVLFHNGTVADWWGMFWGVLSSLSEEDVKRVFSVEYLSDSYVVSLLVYRYGHEVLKFCDDTSKWLVFSSEPVFYGRWERDEKMGFAFSNLSWRYSLEGYRNFLSGWRGRF